VNYEKKVPQVGFQCAETKQIAPSSKAVDKDERQRSENRDTHPDYLLCVNENAFWKTPVSSKDREALTTATLGVIECQRVAASSHAAIFRSGRRYW
jgi:hypothetical protein